jgi:hypothetical protein
MLIASSHRVLRTHGHGRLASLVFDEAFPLFRNKKKQAPWKFPLNPSMRLCSYFFCQKKEQEVKLFNKI